MRFVIIMREVVIRYKTRRRTRFSFSLSSFSLGLSNSRAREKFQRIDRYTRSIAHCSAKRLKASPTVRAGFTNWCRASTTASVLSSAFTNISFKAFRYASRASNPQIIFDYCMTRSFPVHPCPKC